MSALEVEGASVGLRTPMTFDGVDKVGTVNVVREVETDGDVVTVAVTGASVE